MDLIYELCIKEAKALPDFLDSDEYVVRMRLQGNELDEGLLALFRAWGENVTNSLSTEELLIIDSLFHEKSLEDELLAYIKRLVNVGLVEKNGNDQYRLAEKHFDAKYDDSNDDGRLTVNENVAKNAENVTLNGDDVTVNCENVTVNDIVNGEDAALNATQKSVLSLISQKNGITVDGMAKALSRSRRTIQRSLRVLQEGGFVVRVGSDKTGYWKAIRTG